MEYYSDTRNAIRELRTMFKWAIKKTFENNEDARLSLKDINSAAYSAWMELCDEGEIVFENKNETNCNSIPL